MQVSAEVLHALTTALSAAFTKGVGRVNPQYRSIATVIPSSGASNTYGWVEDFPTIKEWIGARQLKELAQAGYVITNKTWENSVKVKREKIEDDQIGLPVGASGDDQRLRVLHDAGTAGQVPDGFAPLARDASVVRAEAESGFYRSPPTV